jgi:hypothetical protein
MPSISDLLTLERTPCYHSLAVQKPRRPPSCTSIALFRISKHDKSPTALEPKPLALDHHGLIPTKPSSFFALPTSASESGPPSPISHAPSAPLSYIHKSGTNLPDFPIPSLAYTNSSPLFSVHVLTSSIRIKNSVKAWGLIESIYIWYRSQGILSVLPSLDFISR